MRRINFNDGWEFCHDGNTFCPVVVPHDALRHARRGPDAPAGSASGFTYGISARYRKAFHLDAYEASQKTLLEFEGVYRDAHIAVNGVPCTAPPYGFTPFFIDATDMLREGANLVTVSIDTTDQPDCRWYAGAGIHRPVWLWRGGDAHIEPEGVRVTTLSTSPARIRVQVDCGPGAVHVDIRDANGTCIVQGQGRDSTLSIPDALLWSAESPNLYTCHVELKDDSGLLDEAEAAFGIRTIAWGADGLAINGHKTLLRGGCIHCDGGILGAASFPEAERWRVKKLRDAGFNALRIAHNPAPSSLLEACDEIGMYVMDEAWDVWFTPKSTYDYSRHFLEWCDYDLVRMASRDYNHPSVIMYSIGNEIADPITPSGVKLEESLVDLLHSVDPSRPVTCGFNLTMMVMERMGKGWYGNSDGVADPAADAGAPRGSLLFNLGAQALGSGMTLLANAPGADKLVSPALDAFDIAGYNYASKRYPIDVRKHPDRVIVGTETFPFELKRNWDMVERFDALIGDFMWAAWDYLGEAGAGAWAYTAEEAGFSKPWPWLVAGSGAFDLIGDPGAPAALAQAVWKTTHVPSIQVRPVKCMEGRTYKATWRGSDALPSWSWQGCAGVVAAVEVYDGFAHSMRLDLNGETIATKRVRGCIARFNVEYEPGTLTAWALDKDGRVIATSSLASATAPLHLSLKPIQKRVVPGGIALVEISIVGSNGIVESNADEKLVAKVEGGELIALGSALPAPIERFSDGVYPSYRGRAMAAVHRATSGSALLHVRGAGLAGETVEVVFRDAS